MSTIETLEKVRNMSKVNSKDIVLYSYLGTYFAPFSSVSIVDFERKNVCWEETYL